MRNRARLLSSRRSMEMCARYKRTSRPNTCFDSVGTKAEWTERNLGHPPLPFARHRGMRAFRNPIALHPRARREASLYRPANTTGLPLTEAAGRGCRHTSSVRLSTNASPITAMFIRAGKREKQCGSHASTRLRVNTSLLLLAVTRPRQPQPCCATATFGPSSSITTNGPG